VGYFNYLPDTHGEVSLARLEGVLELLTLARAEDRWVTSQEILKHLDVTNEKIIRRAMKLLKDDGAIIEDRTDRVVVDYSDDKSPKKYKLLAPPRCLTIVPLISILQTMNGLVPESNTDVDMSVLMTTMEEKVRKLPEDKRRKFNNAKTRFRVLDGLRVPAVDNHQASMGIIEKVIHILSDDIPKKVMVHAHGESIEISPQYLLNLSNSRRYFMFGWENSGSRKPTIFELDSSVSLDEKIGYAQYPQESEDDPGDLFIRALYDKYPHLLDIEIVIDRECGYYDFIAHSLGNRFFSYPEGGRPGHFAVRVPQDRADFFAWISPFLPHVRVEFPEDLKSAVRDESLRAVRSLLHRLEQP